MSVNKLSILDGLGALTGSTAARAKIVGAVGVVQGALNGKLQIAGEAVGSILGSNPFEALAKGAAMGNNKATDDLAMSTLGVSVTQVKDAAVAGGKWVLIAGAVLLAALFWKRRKA